MGVFNVDLGCDLIASQDFVTLTLFPLLKKSQLPFLLIFYFSPGIEPQDRKDFGMRKRKLPPNHPNAKKRKKERKRNLSCEDFILLGRKSCLREGENLSREVSFGTPECCGEILPRAEMLRGRLGLSLVHGADSVGNLFSSHVKEVY